MHNLAGQLRATHQTASYTRFPARAGICGEETNASHLHGTNGRGLSPETLNSPKQSPVLMARFPKSFFRQSTVLRNSTEISDKNAASPVGMQRRSLGARLD